jgi:hypothetical protein
MRRVQLYKACNHFGVPFKEGAPAIEMRNSLQVHGITDQQLMDFTKVVVLNVKDEKGNAHQEVYPYVEPHETARLAADGQAINYDKVIAERAKAVAALEQSEDQLEVQNATMQLILDKLAKLEANAVPLTSLSPPQLKGIAKRRGLDATGLKKKDELIALLEG